MTLTRRQFLKWAGLTGTGAVVFAGCTVPDAEIEIQSPLRLPEDLVTGRDNFYATVAQGPAGSEGLIVRIMEGRAKKVEGNPDYPVNGNIYRSRLNAGKHSARTEALLQALYHPDRIKQPLARIAKGGPFRPTSWPDVLNRLTAELEQADPASVLIVTPALRGQIATVTKRFADAYGARLMGFEPVDTTVLRTAVKRVFHQDALPDFDLARTKFLVNFGADFLGTWLNPVHLAMGYGEFRHGSDRGDAGRGHFVQVDSRFSTTTAAADQWLYANPGTEGLVAMAMAYTIIAEGLGDNAAAAAMTGGAGASALRAFAPSAIAAQTGVPEDTIVHLARSFADPANRPALAMGGGSAAAQTNGVFNLTAIYALNYLVGSVNRPGGVILNPSDHLERIDAASLAEWETALADMRSGNIKVVLVKDANFLHGLPAQLGAEAALKSVDRIVSFSSFPDEVTAVADWVLPGHTPLEEWGTDTPDPGPGYVTYGFQQPVVRPFRDTLAFGDVLLRTAKELGVDTNLPWETMKDAVRAKARELHATGRGSVQKVTFEEFWKRALERGGWWDDQATVRNTPTPPRLPSGIEAPTLAGNGNAYPFYLVPFESRGLAAGQLAHLPWLQSIADPVSTVAWQTWAEINPRTAKNLGFKEDDIIIVDAPNGRSIRAVVYLNPATPPNVVGVPFGQGHKHFTGVAANRGANVFDVIDARKESETGALAWAATRVRLVKTNKRMTVAKLEGTDPAVQLPDDRIVEVMKSNGQQMAH